MPDQMQAKNIWPFRSLLFVPGHKPDWIRKATRYDPDALIMDLEDAVPPAEKVGARSTTKDGITFCQSVGLGAFVRLNPFEEGGEADVLGIMTPGLTAVCLPKLANVEQIRELADVLSYAEGKAGMERGSVAIVGIPETPEGLTDIRLLAQASKRVKGFLNAIIDRISDDVVFTGDTVRAAGFIPTKEGLEQMYMVSKMCMDSRAGGAPYPMATIIGTDINDAEAARKIAKRIKATGFVGCAAIHPNHVAIANEIFRPNANDIKFAVGVINAMKDAEANGLYAVRYKGMMIDQANVRVAELVLAEAKRRGTPIPATGD
jgi:citrate lyase subunit beta/citryl-CoA lyase